MIAQSGEKTFDVRKFDRDYQVGDSIELREWNPATSRLRRARNCKAMNGEMETLSNFAWRIGVPLKRVSRKLGRADCPPFHATFGRLGSVRCLVATPELERFMRTDPRKGKKVA